MIDVKAIYTHTTRNLKTAWQQPLVCLPARALASKRASLIASSLLWIRKHWKEIWTENSMKNKHSELCAQRKWQKLNCSHKNKHELDFLYSVQHKATVFHQISFVYLVYKWMFVNEKSLLSPFCSSFHTHTLNWKKTIKVVGSLSEAFCLSQFFH